MLRHSVGEVNVPYPWPEAYLDGWKGFLTPEQKAANIKWNSLTEDERNKFQSRLRENKAWEEKHGKLYVPKHFKAKLKGSQAVTSAFEANAKAELDKMKETGKYLAWKPFYWFKDEDGRWQQVEASRIKRKTDEKGDFICDDHPDPSLSAATGPVVPMTRMNASSGPPPIVVAYMEPDEFGNFDTLPEPEKKSCPPVPMTRMNASAEPKKRSGLVPLTRPNACLSCYTFMLME